MTKILVLSAGGTAGINFIKSLRMSDNKYDIHAADINAYHLELTKSDRRFVVPNCSSSNYKSTIYDLHKEHKYDFIHAQADIEVEKLSEIRNELKLPVLLPMHETILICRDKLRTNEVLRDHFIKVPFSICVEAANGWKEELFNRKKMWIRAIKGAGSKAALPVTSERQALDWINYWVETHRLETEDFMLSEFLPGKEYAWQSIWLNGELITSACRERIEYLMGNLFPSGQSSSPSVAKTVHNQWINNLCTDAIKVIDKNATGIFCVDIKENSENVPCITEINAGRFFTTSDFFSTLGANMPNDYVQLGTIMNRRQHNAVPKDYYWIRTVDTEPKCIQINE